MRILLLGVALISGGWVSAQQYHTWTSAGGHTVDAVFVRVDEANETLKLLVPKAIELSKLDDSSLEKARLLARKIGDLAEGEPISLRKEKWYSSDGRFVEAPFVNLNEKDQTLTVLVERTLDFSDLDPTSVFMARTLQIERKTGGRAAIREPYAGIVQAIKSTSEIASIGDTEVAPWRNGVSVIVRGPFPVWGIRDFDWFDFPIEMVGTSAERKINEDHGVERVFEATKGSIISRRRHPKSNAWVYQVTIGSKKLWILGGDLKVQESKISGSKNNSKLDRNGSNSLNQNDDSDSAIDERKKHIREEYVKLMRFAKTHDFREWGFAVGGPYNAWLVSILSDRDRQEYKDFEGMAMTMALWQLGNEYLETKGAENRFTNLFRERLSEYIDVSF